LAEKGLAYERVYIDLANKPEWFLQLSPLGKVPLLRVSGAAVFETAERGSHLSRLMQS
jgi:glutathione S-transferase